MTLQKQTQDGVTVDTATPTTPDATVSKATSTEDAATASTAASAAEVTTVATPTEEVTPMVMDTQEYDYVIVGSGAGGGVLAARLAEQGFVVAVIEAGEDPLADAENEENTDTAAQLDKEQRPLSYDYKVPAFHPFCSEQPSIRWDYWVKHYSNRAQADRDPKACEGKVWYPRIGALGGCASHHAMIFVYPSNADWNTIAELTGDYSWNAENMRRYFEKIENCGYRFFIYRLLAKFGFNPTRHGWKGWLKTEVALAKNAMHDKELMRIVLAAAHKVFSTGSDRLWRFFWRWIAQFDPNDWRLIRDKAWGVRMVPMTTRNHQRYSPRERLREVQQRCPDKLHILLNTLVTKIQVDKDERGKLRARGVYAEQGKRLYKAHPDASTQPGTPLLIKARREVIISAGAFNTPQLLQLSGIGDPDELKDIGVDCILASPHVGKHLQDRYEVPVVSEVKKPWEVLKDAKYRADASDPNFVTWQENPSNSVYSTNGGILSVITNSAHNRTSAGGDNAGVAYLQHSPDLYLLALLAEFRGYQPGYSEVIKNSHDKLSWVVLKGYTNNTAGYVKLASPDPKEMPEINFKYFDEGNDEWGTDLDAVVDGMHYVREMNEAVKQDIKAEIFPGAEVKTRQQLETFVKDNAWGHHASCTCRMGRCIEDSVVDSRLRVHGIQGLRIVDASIFPRIPGLFILSAIYMVAEKAADDIINRQF